MKSRTKNNNHLMIKSKAMQKRFFMLLFIFQLAITAKLFSQNIAFNATGNLPDTSAMLDVSSSNKGFLLPRMATAQVAAIPLPATGLIIYNTTLNAFQVNTGTPTSPSWQTLGTTIGNWLAGGNSGLNSGQKFIGTTDSVSLRFRTNNTQRMVLDSLGNVGIGSSPSFTASPDADKFLVDAGTTSSYNVITAKGNFNNYLQFNVQNQSSGASASSDLVATADNGSETTNFVNMGVNGSGYTGGVMGSPDDAYLFNIGNNLLVGTGSSSKAVVFMTGGTSQATNERMRIDGTGKVGIGTTSPGSTLDVKGTLHLSGSTSGYVGIAPAAAAGSTTYTLPSADGTNGQQLTTNGSGVLSWVAAGGSTTNVISSSGNVVTSTVNGITGTTTAVNSVANASSTNILTTTVNGVAATGVNIINSNALNLSSGNLTSTVNGVASSSVSLSSLDSSIYKMDGTLWGARAVTMGANNLTFGATTGNLIFNPSSTGKVGIGTTSPASTLDVKGTLHLSGSTSGYVGFAPAAAAGSTTYTLPTADGTSGQVLSTNGSGTLSWATAGSGSGWGLTGNSGTSSSTNFIGTTDNTDFIFKRYNTAAGSLAATSTSLGVSSSVGATQASAFGASSTASGSASVAVGYNALSTMASSIAIGPTSMVQPGSGSTDDIAIGDGANVTGGSAYSYSTAIGSAAQVQAANGLAIGKSSAVSSQYGIAIGDGAQVQSNTYALAFGQNAYSNSANAIAIGSGASSNKTQAQGAYDVSIGYNAYASSQDAIAIGDHAQAQGTNSIAIGTNLYNGTANTVAIGNSNVTSFLLNGASSGSSKAFIVGSSSTNGNGAYLTTGGTWTNASDRNLKEDFSTVNGEEILSMVSHLDITRWKYKNTNEYHIGPMAQDFYKSFGLGNDDKHISTIDPAGIALVSIKVLKQENDELYKKLAEQQTIIEQLQKSVEEIKARLR
jgi:hypothetical protein